MSGELFSLPQQSPAPASSLASQHISGFFFLKEGDTADGREPGFILAADITAVAQNSNSDLNVLQSQDAKASGSGNRPGVLSSVMTGPNRGHIMG